MPLKSLSLNSQLVNIIEKFQELHSERLDAEIQDKVNKTQELLVELYLMAEKKVENFKHNYAFLGRDHVFFEGDHNDHSGAV